jgi:hypothetical protein
MLAALVLAGPLANAQAATRFVGSITAISGSSMTVKTDSGELRQFDVPSTAPIQRITPGQTDLSHADTIQFSDLAVGDRVLVRLDPNAPGPAAQATIIVAIKQQDVAQKQEQEREDWQRRGAGGLVKSVDSAAGVIVLTTGAGAAAKTVTIHTTKATILKRYAPNSERYDLAQLAPIDAIHAGDQLRARGVKNADGTEIDAEEVVSGSFRNISGTVTSSDTANATLVVKDLVTKKQVTVHFTPEAQMRRLPDRMAQMLAARLKGDSADNGARGAFTQNPNGGAGRPAGGFDSQQMLSRAPAIQLADLKKGDAVMLVSTPGATEVTAITLLAGVEPLLEAPEASRNLLSNWSMDTGAGSVEAAQ